MTKKLKEKKSKKSLENKNPVGRPTTYTFELAQQMCHKISTSSKTIRQLCEENDNWPNTDTFHVWKNEHKEFSDLYREAKFRQIDVLVEDIRDISNDDQHDVIIHEGKVIQNTVKFYRDRLKVDNIKWLAGKIAPKIYGDKIQAELNLGDEEGIKKVRDLIHKCAQDK